MQVFYLSLLLEIRSTFTSNKHCRSFFKSSKKSSTKPVTKSTTKMTCAGCGNDGSLKCSGCDEAPRYPGEPGKTQYCSRECQKKNWKAHKILCQRLQSRKSLYRAASIL